MNVDPRQIVIDAKIRAAVTDRKLVIVIARSDITAARLNVLGELAVTQAGQNKSAKDRLIDLIVCCYERLENIYAAPDQGILIHSTQDVSVCTGRLKNNRSGRAVAADEFINLKQRRAGCSRTRAVGSREAQTA